jgi:KipI family sensor histidine kinase inhibitor
VSDLRIREAGDSALLLELDAVIDPRVNARAIAIARAVVAARVPGVRDVVPTFCAVGVYFDPLVADVGRIESLLRQAMEVPVADPAGAHVDIPVAYGGEFGPDLPEVAAFGRLTGEQVVHLHASRLYRVFMLGFLPGFPYLGVVDDRIAAPRRASPRIRVPAGSVGIAGMQTGIYPRDSPGGWQIIGRTPMRLFDQDRVPPALLSPGDTVTFVPGAASGPPLVRPLDGVRDRDRGSADGRTDRRVTVLSAGLFTTVQDEGRWGHQATGVPVAGPLDPYSHRLANTLVGNEREAAALEITIAGPELRLEHDALVAVTGADLAPTLDSASMPMNRPVAGRAGSVIRFGGRRHGARSYLAFDGGVSVPVVLGSRATHVLSGLGGLHGRALRAGDAIPLGPPRPPRRPASADIERVRSAARLRVRPGPQHDAISSAALDILASTRFELARDSDRMGYRLTGARLPADPDGAMISTSTFTGSIQLPPSGEPVLLMADRQTTGGYPQIATVITADLPAAGQLAPGDRVVFEICSRREALGALVRQEGALLALE